ncbi:MAG TPA: FAD-dependent oxidoreductase [Dehalococcoidia bacterium]|nr:FAD-dependent oxidoreductase [Dehalococcoidia bacterium]
MPSFRYLILGGGMVAGYAAQAMAERGLAAGDLAIVSADSALPYERPPLSKGFLAGKDTEASVFISDAAFYREHGIELRIGATVIGIDLGAKRLHTSGGEAIGFESLLIATGAQPRTFNVPGAEQANIHYLRSLDDSRSIKARIPAVRQALVIGGGFIGMEVAAVLAQQGVATTLAFPEQRVWARFFTPEMSAFFQRYYRERGVTLAAGERVTAFEPGQGERQAVAITASGRRLPADLVVAGIGVRPVTGLFEQSGLVLDNGIVVNEYLETNVPGVYAAGDVAHYRDVLFEKTRRVEHWDNAVEQGKHAARLLLGERVPFVHVPYFFSDDFDLSYELWGDTADAERVVYRGDVTTSSFSAWWLAGTRLLAAFAMNRPDDERDAAQRWIADRTPVDAGRVQNDQRPLEEP